MFIEIMGGTFYKYCLHYIYMYICCLSTINLCSSNLFFLIGVQRLTYQLLVQLLVLHCLFQCLLLGYRSHQIQVLQEIWCRFRACCLKVLCFLDSSVELLLVMRMSPASIALLNCWTENIVDICKLRKQLFNGYDAPLE